MPRFDPRPLRTLQGTKLWATGYRNQARGFDPRSGEGARRFGGRFNAPNSYPVVYLCTTPACAAAELTRQARRQGLAVEDLLPRELWLVSAELTAVLDLTDLRILDQLGVERSELVRDDLQLTQEIGQAAHDCGFQAICSASVTGVDEVVAIFPTNLSPSLMKAELVTEWRTPADLA